MSCVSPVAAPHDRARGLVLAPPCIRGRAAVPGPRRRLRPSRPTRRPTPPRRDNADHPLGGGPGARQRQAHLPRRTRHGRVQAALVRSLERRRRRAPRPACRAARAASCAARSRNPPAAPASPTTDPSPSRTPHRTRAHGPEPETQAEPAPRPPRKTPGRPAHRRSGRRHRARRDVRDRYAEASDIDVQAQVIGALRREVFGFLPYWEVRQRARSTTRQAVDDRLLRRRAIGHRRPREDQPRGGSTTSAGAAGPAHG